VIKDNGCCFFGLWFSIDQVNAQNFVSVVILVAGYLGVVMMNWNVSTCVWVFNSIRCVCEGEEKMFKKMIKTLEDDWHLGGVEGVQSCLLQQQPNFSFFLGVIFKFSSWFHLNSLVSSTLGIFLVNEVTLEGFGLGGGG
jgi:hypothetical protein